MTRQQVTADTHTGTIHLYNPWALNPDGTQPAECGRTTGIHTRTMNATIATCGPCVTAQADAEIRFLAAEDVRRAQEDEREWDGPYGDDSDRAECEMDRAENQYASRCYQDPK